MKNWIGCLMLMLWLVTGIPALAIEQQTWEQQKAEVLSLIDSERSYSGTEVRELVGEILQAASEAINIASYEAATTASAETLREILPALEGWKAEAGDWHRASIVSSLVAFGGGIVAGFMISMAVTFAGQ